MVTHSVIKCVVMLLSEPSTDPRLKLKLRLVGHKRLLHRQVDLIDFSFLFRALKGKEEKLKAESEEDKMMYNKTSQIKQISLFVLVLMAGAMVAL